MKRLFLAAVLVAISRAQSPVQVKAGALTCGAIRRASAAGLVNVQSYCYAGSPVVTNYSNLLAPGASTTATHVFGAGCGKTGSPCDIVVWEFSDSGNGVIAYQVAIDGTTLKTGTLP